MIAICEESSTLEAHKILRLLKREGVSARLESEHEQCDNGELQAIGQMKIMVEESDATTAKSIISRLIPKKSTSNGNYALSIASFSFLLGAFLATAIAVFNQPKNISYHHEGQFNNSLNVGNTLISKTELDRNNDNVIDFIYKFDTSGTLKYAVFDDDFDGIFESKTYFEKGKPLWTKSDTNNDSFTDLRVEYKNGIINSVSFFDAQSKQPVKIKTYEAMKVVKSQEDTTGDGKLNITHLYDDLENIVHTFKH